MLEYNRLVQYCTDNHIDIPMYICDKINETWTVILKNNEYTVTVKNQLSEIIGINNASKRLLKYYNSCAKRKIKIIIVDLENKKITKFSKKCIYIGLMRSTDPRINNHQKYWYIPKDMDLEKALRNGNNKILFAIDALPIKDLVDHFMTCFYICLYNLIKNNEKYIFDIYIYTSDKSAQNTKICYDHFLKLSKLFNYRIKNAINENQLR